MTSGGYIYYGFKLYLRYWANYLMPVFLIIHNPETAVVLSQKVERDNVTELQSGRGSIVIPEGNVLAPRFKQQASAASRLASGRHAASR